jgi:YVTN family beta-propeller protein
MHFAIALLLATLSTGVTLDPASPTNVVGNFPLAAAASTDGRFIALLLCGWREQGIQIVDRSSGSVTQTIAQPAAFIGLTFSPDGKTLYASGGNDDVVYVYRWSGDRAAEDGKIVLQAKKDSKSDGTSYPAGLACSRDGRFLYVAENLGDSVVVIDTTSRKIVQRIVTDRYPYAVAADAHHLYVSCWGDQTVNAFAITGEGRLGKRSQIAVARHPSALLLSGNRLFVTSSTTDSISVIDITTSKVVRTFRDAPPTGPREGSTPNALTISADGKRLFVAEADSNAVAVFDGIRGTLLGRVPTEWYPASLVRVGNDVVVVNAKGRGTHANLARAQPNQRNPPGNRDHILGQFEGTLMQFSANVTANQLSELTQRVEKANGWDRMRNAPRYPPFKHVIYIIKENRTYDQVFGDMPEGDGDRSLLFFDENVSPNHHALARRFGLFDRFFTNAEVSPQGHNWSTAAYSSDYIEKTMPSQYSSRGRPYDYEGTNRNRLATDEDDVASPSTGYLWDLAMRKKISFRNYGEFVIEGKEVGRTEALIATKRMLTLHTCLDFPPFDLDITDQKRVNVWLGEFNRFVTDGNLPALQIVRLPNDHTHGTSPNKPTPRAYMADNDLGLGRIVEAVSKSPFWRDTVLFVVEDDAQNGPDHVDAHRSVLLIISAYNKPGVIHRFTNTTDVLASIEEILGLDSMSQFDYYGRPLRGIFAATADLTTYTAARPNIDMNEKNPPAAKAAALLDFSRADAVDDDQFNRILWQAIKGDVPYPEPKRAPSAP